MPKTILILAANPRGTSPLRLSEEVRDIERALRRSHHPDAFLVKTSWAATVRDLQQALLEHKPHVVHFSGHGDEDRGLMFENEVGQPQFVSGKALATLFGLFSETLECVVLNGCHSEEQARAIAQHVPFVIGMNEEILDRAAIAFAVGFYTALADGQTVEFAYKMGCSAIELTGISGASIPVFIVGTRVEPAPSTVTATQTEASDKGAIEVFFSYAHEDAKLRDELAKHLKLMERQKVISAWYDQDITAGQEFDEVIQERLNRAKIILLLISPDFLNSDFCWGVELERAMQRHEAGDAYVVPILLRPMDDWESAPFGKLWPLPTNKKPITTWTNRDEAFTAVAKGIRNVVASLKK